MPGRARRPILPGCALLTRLARLALLTVGATYPFGPGLTLWPSAALGTLFSFGPPLALRAPRPRNAGGALLSLGAHVALRTLFPLRASGTFAALALIANFAFSSAFSLGALDPRSANTALTSPGTG